MNEVKFDNFSVFRGDVLGDFGCNLVFSGRNMQFGFGMRRKFVGFGISGLICLGLVLILVVLWF